MARNKDSPNRLGALQGHIKARQRMLDEGKFSLLVGEGYPVVVTSGSTKEERQSLAEHSDKLTEDKSREFFEATIIRQPRIGDIEDIVVDPEVTSIAFLGDGNFGTLHLALPGTDSVERITWYSLARMVTHLKTGTIEERTCTKIINPEKDVRVSLSSFIVADQTRILGTVDEAFATHHGFDVFTPRLHSIYYNSTNDALQLRQPAGFKLQQ